MTATDLTAGEIVWDLDPLLPAPDDAGLAQLLDAADAKADELATYRGKVATIDADGLVAFMQGLAEVHELIGRAGSFAGLDFAADTTDPALDSEAADAGAAPALPGAWHRGVSIVESCREAAERAAGHTEVLSTSTMGGARVRKWR